AWPLPYETPIRDLDRMLRVASYLIPRASSESAARPLSTHNLQASACSGNDFSYVLKHQGLSSRGARVVLLTATPVNNALSDLYFQLRLFAGDGEFRDIGVADLAAVFRTAGAAGDDAAAARGVLAVLRQVMIRRTRPFLREHYAGVRLPGRGGRSRVLSFPERAPPRPVRYS